MKFTTRIIKADDFVTVDSEEVSDRMYQFVFGLGLKVFLNSQMTSIRSYKSLPYAEARKAKAQARKIAKANAIALTN